MRSPLAPTLPTILIRQSGSFDGLCASKLVGSGFCCGSTNLILQAWELSLPEKVYGCNHKHMFARTEPHASYCPTRKLVLMESTTAFIYLRKSNRRISHELSQKILYLITGQHTFNSVSVFCKLEKKKKKTNPAVSSINAILNLSICSPGKLGVT